MTAQVQEVQTPQQDAPKKPEQSFAEMRKLIEAERAEKAQMQKRLEELERATKAKASAPVIDDDEDSDEPYLDPKTFKKKMAKFEESLEEKIERKAEEKARSLIEEQSWNQYLKQNADFEQTMQPEVLQKFAQKETPLTEAILAYSANPTEKNRQRLVYESIKVSGVNKPEAPKETIQSKIDANKRSPYYIPASQGTAPYAGNGDFSPVGQKNAYAHLQELKGRLRLG